MRQVNTAGFVRLLVGFLIVMGTLVLPGSCKSLILAKGWPEYEGEFSNLPVQQPVTVLRDKHGIPHIYARNKHDLLVAQGFVHAQDRLWQMETFRRVVSGRLSEFAGEGRVNLDTFCRMLGFPQLRRKAFQALSPEDRAMAQAYADGVNAYISLLGEDLSNTYSRLEEELGGNPRRWEWGKLHYYYWKHAGGTSWFKAKLLNVGPVPAAGDFNTVNCNAYIATRDEYKATMLPGLRMVIPLDDVNAMKVSMPLGQSCQPGHGHYDDLVGSWAAGKLLDFPVERADVEAITVSKLILSP
jgi:acyl-homoserine lactone acylase PvdQ